MLSSRAYLDISRHCFSIYLPHTIMSADARVIRSPSSHGTVQLHSLARRPMQLRRFLKPFTLLMAMHGIYQAVITARLPLSRPAIVWTANV
jgi:hypothetical protein